jgi:hypothetical protein
MARWTFPHDQNAFLFDEVKIGAAKKFALQRQMNRARGGRVLERQRVAEHCGLFVSTSCSINRFRVLARLARSLHLSFRVLNDCGRVLARCIASTYVFTLMARAERRRFFYSTCVALRR